MRLKPFFSYFGSKWRIASRYPPPEFDEIVEPFAGSAGYALHFADRDVTLVEASEPIAGIWSYLTRVSAAEISKLPLLAPGETVDDFALPQEARWLIGMWVNPGSAQPKKTMLDWDRSGHWAPDAVTWGETIRLRIARQVSRIRHWKVIHGGYERAPDVRGTWFVDPPYQGALGRHYPCGSSAVDFEALGAWCQAREGQTIVCEAAGATWLPFRFLLQTDQHRGAGPAEEAIWTQSESDYVFAFSMGRVS